MEIGNDVFPLQKHLKYIHLSLFSLIAYYIIIPEKSVNMNCG